jgi:hypothetical protein
MVEQMTKEQLLVWAMDEANVSLKVHDFEMHSCYSGVQMYPIIL